MGIIHDETRREKKSCEKFVDDFSTAYLDLGQTRPKMICPFYCKMANNTLRIRFFSRVGHQFCFHACFDFILTFYSFECIQISIHLIHVNCGEPIMTKRFKVGCRQSQNVTLLFYLAPLCNIRVTKLRHETTTFKFEHQFVNSQLVDIKLLDCFYFALFWVSHPKLKLGQIFFFCFGS